MKMLRSVFVILLAIVCGVSAAIGVRKLSPAPEQIAEEKKPVYVAATSIRRGAQVDEADIKAVDWPAGLMPEGVITRKEDAVGRSALAAITTGEPLLIRKLSDSKGRGFASNSIPPGMRACTIQTNGPTERVAGLVLPDDKVDVLLNLRGNSNDETGGGSTLTLLQSATVLAIDDTLDVDEDALKRWMKEGYASVTLLVTPEQSLQVSLGQAVGTLSLALRNGDDEDFISDTRPVTINQIKKMPAADTFPLHDLLEHLAATTKVSPGDVQDASITNDQNSGDSSVADSQKERPGERQEVRASAEVAPVEQGPPRQSYIVTLRGSQSGFVRVLGGAESRQ